jgi:hypothetical protein
MEDDQSARLCIEYHCRVAREGEQPDGPTVFLRSITDPAQLDRPTRLEIDQVELPLGGVQCGNATIRELANPCDAGKVCRVSRACGLESHRGNLLCTHRRE